MKSISRSVESSSVRKIADASVHRVFLRAMLQAAIGSVAAFSVADMNPMYFILSMLGIAMVWGFSVAPSRPAPRMVINSILLVVVAIGGIEMLRVGVGVSAFAVFVTLLLAVKLLDLRSPRDDGQVLVLSVSVLIAAVLTSNTLFTGLFMIVAIVLILRAVVLYQIHAVLDKAATNITTINTKARIDIRSMLFATGFLCTIIGSVIFVVLPRNIGMQAFGQWGGAGRSVSGFSDTVELGRPGFISQSSTPVLDLTITNRDGINIGSENTPAIYLRGAVLSVYDSGRWDRSPVMHSPMTSRTQLIPANTLLNPRTSVDRSRWDQQLDITMRSSPGGPSYLFAPWQTIAFRVGSEPMRLGLDFERGLFLKDGMGGRIEYAVRSINTEFDEIVYTPSDLRDSIVETDIEQDIRRLASEILVDGGVEPSPEKRPIRDDLAAVRLIETHLRSRYAYTLDSQPVPAGVDATKWFLFDRKKGHCEYYASALALMTRAVGIPARVLTGYIVSDYNTVTAKYVVRESNAHAWIEAQIAPGQWRTFDGTPPADFHAIHEPDPSIWRSIAEMYESVEFLWVRTIIGYDSVARQNIMGATSTDFGLSKLGDSILTRFAVGRSRLLMRGALIAGIVFAGSMFIGIMLLKYRPIVAGLLDGIVFWFKQNQARFTSGNGDHADPRYAHLEGLVLRMLRRLEIPKPAWKPMKTHLDEQFGMIGLGSEQAHTALVEAAQVLYEQKFSPVPKPIDSQQISRLESQLRKSEKSFNKTR